MVTFALRMPRWRNGRRARFRCECREACRFESYSGHFQKEFLCGNSFFRARIEPVQSVAVWQTCLRCRVAEANCSAIISLELISQKVNKYPFCLSAQCLQLCCSSPPLSLFGLLKPSATARVRCGAKGCWCGDGMATVDGFTSHLQFVAVWQTCLWSMIIAIAISCLCLIIVFENRFSAIISQTQTISDCNHLPAVCSNLQRPVESCCGANIVRGRVGRGKVVEGCC